MLALGRVGGAGIKGTTSMSIWFIEATLKPGTALQTVTAAVGRNPNHCPARNRYIWRCMDIGDANRVFVCLNDLPDQVAKVSRRMIRKGFGALRGAA